MCSTCTTAIDAAATNAVLFAAFVSTRWDLVSDRFKGRSSLGRELAVWEANAEFTRSMGLEPIEVLGAPPAVSVIDKQPVLS